MEEDQVLTEKQRRLIEVCWVIRLLGWLALGLALLVAGYMVYATRHLSDHAAVNFGVPASFLNSMVMRLLLSAGDSVLLGLMAVGLTQLVPYLFGLFNRPPLLARLLPWFAFAKAAFVLLAVVAHAHVFLQIVPQPANLVGSILSSIGVGFVGIVFFAGLGVLVRSSLPLMDDARAMV